MMKALLLTFSPQTGARSGGVNPRDPNLFCGRGWQDIENGIEIRAVVDGRVDSFRNIEGITILETNEEIQEHVTRLFPEKVTYSVTSQTLMNLSLKSSEIDLSEIPQDVAEGDFLMYLYEAGVKGIGRFVHGPQSVESLESQFDQRGG